MLFPEEFLTMLTGLSKRTADRASTRPAFRPTLDVLEDRTVPASLGTIDLPLNVSDLHIVGSSTSPQIQGVVNFAGQQAGTFTADLAAQDAAGATTPILDLHVGAIHLNVLGLHVDTSDICLDVTATPGQGLLGDLLGGLTTSGGLLNLNGIISQLGAGVTQAGGLLDQLDSLLDNVLGQTFTVDTLFGGGGGAAAAAAPHAGHVCDVLNLSLGPVDLNVLGLGVHLDDCNDGPVTVDITAVKGEGLLGNLLCGLSDGLGNLNPTQGLIDRVENLFDSLGNLAGAINRLEDVNLSRQAQRLVSQLERQLERLADRVDNLAELNQFIDQVDNVADRLDQLGDAAGSQVDRIFAQLSDQLDRILDRVDRLIDRLTSHVGGH